MRKVGKKLSEKLNEKLHEIFNTSFATKIFEYVLELIFELRYVGPRFSPWNQPLYSTRHRGHWSAKMTLDKSPTAGTNESLYKEALLSIAWVCIGFQAGQLGTHGTVLRTKLR